MEVTTTSRSFDEMNLSAETLSSLDTMGYRAPTEVQSETVPRAMATAALCGSRIVIRTVLLLTKLGKPIAAPQQVRERARANLARAASGDTSRTPGYRDRAASPRERAGRSRPERAG